VAVGLGSAVSVAVRGGAVGGNVGTAVSSGADAAGVAGASCPAQETAVSRSRDNKQIEIPFTIVFMAHSILYISNYWIR
jgi:hypothetical protein